MKNAVGYLRVSSQGQTSGDGFDRQKQAIDQYAYQHGFNIVQTYRENGVSGTIENREALAELLLTVEQNNGIKSVIIERLDRLARDIMVQEAIIRDLNSKGVTLISTTEGDDLCNDSDPTRKLIRVIMGAVAEYEKSMLVMKLQVARHRKKLKTGRKVEGRKSYSEKPEFEKTLLRIKELRRKPAKGKRLTYSQIADKLNEEGFRTVSGGLWTYHRVYQVLNTRKPRSKRALG